MAEERSALPGVASPARRISRLGEEEFMNGQVMIAVDPNQPGNAAAVLDPVTKTVIEGARFANSQEGYGRLAGLAPGAGTAPLGGGGLPCCTPTEHRVILHCRSRQPSGWTWPLCAERVGSAL
jgi:hypothetical protein